MAPSACSFINHVFVSLAYESVSITITDCCWFISFVKRVFFREPLLVFYPCLSTHFHDLFHLGIRSCVRLLFLFFLFFTDFCLTRCRPRVIILSPAEPRVLVLITAKDISSVNVRGPGSLQLASSSSIALMCQALHFFKNFKYKIPTEVNAHNSIWLNSSDL